jgi:hypothetical protein
MTTHPSFGIFHAFGSPNHQYSRPSTYAIALSSAYNHSGESAGERRSVRIIEAIIPSLTLGAFLR